MTELITGVDLVEQMLRSAAGEALSFAQDDLAINGWAIESRIYAEDPYRGFLPSIGRLSRYAPPAEGDQGAYTVRNDTGVREGDEISTFYDPMIAKLCAWAPTRLGAVAGMARALEDFHIEGPGHNTAFLSAVMDQERFASGQLSTRYIVDEFPDGFHGLPVTPDQSELMIAVAGAIHLTLSRRARNRGGHATPERSRFVVVVDDDPREVELTGGGDSLTVAFTDGGLERVLSDIVWRPGDALFRGELDGRPFSATVARAAEGFIIRHRAARAKVLVLTPTSADLHKRLPKKTPPDTSRMVVAPMPGLVVSSGCGRRRGGQIRPGHLRPRSDEDAEHHPRRTRWCDQDNRRESRRQCRGG